MGLVSIFLNIILHIVAGVKRMLCFLHLTRRRKNSGSILPLHSEVKVLPTMDDIQTSLPSNNVELESWDSWGGEDKGDFGRRSTIGAEANTSQQRYSGVSRFPGKKPVEPEPEPELNYFQELQLEPSISRTKKIVVRRKDDYGSSTISSRLAMTSDIPLNGSELGTLEDADNIGWSSEAMEDLSGEADSAIREKRRLERERRLQEHQIKKHEKEVNKIVGPRKDKMAAIKMS